MIIDIRKPTLQEFSLFKLHPKNIEEIRLLSDLTPDVCMSFLWEVALENYMVFIDNNPACMFGVMPENKAWFFFSADVKRLPISFYKLTKEKIDNIVKNHGYIEGHIYSKNTFALQLAKFWGWNVDRAKPYGNHNKLFCYFFKRKED